MGVEWCVARGRNRRRVERGVEAEPRRWGRRIGRDSLALALVAATAAGAVRGWRALDRTGALCIRTVRFEGLVRSTADELLALSPVKPGDRLLSADVDAMEQA